MKKICFITTVPITLQTFVLSTAEYIHNHTDWDISMICSYDEEFKRQLPNYIHYYPVKMERGIRIGGIKAMLEMKKIFKREKFDLIQYSTPNASLYASLAGKIAKVPVRLYCQWGMAYVGFSGIKRKVFKAIEKLVCSLSTWIEPDSNSNLEFSHEEKLFSKEKGSVIWNGSACGVNITKFDIKKKLEYRKKIQERYGLFDDLFVFGFVGRITRDKGINELLTAFKVISEQNDNARLMMIGSTEIDSTVNQELYNWAMKTDKVIFVGYTNVVEQYLSAMDCYILPSYREGFGMGVIEAEAMGLPVIVSNIPGPTDAMIHKKTGLIVAKKDSVGLKKAMSYLMDNQEMAKRYGKAGIKHVETNFEQAKFFEYVLEDRKMLLGDGNE